MVLLLREWDDVDFIIAQINRNDNRFGPLGIAGVRNKIGGVGRA
jgi:hypothetical protein